MAVNAADAWQESGSRGDRPYRAPRADRADRAAGDGRPARPRSAVPPRTPVPPRSPVPPRRAPERGGYDDRQYSRPPVPRRPEHSRPVPRDLDRDRGYDRDLDRDLEREPARGRREPRPEFDREPRRASAAEPTRGLRGVLGVLAVFLVTLAAAGVESFLSTGLGTITTAALIAVSAIAAFLVRRRDVFSVVVCPPLVFVGVAVVNMVAAPSVQLSGIKSLGLVLVTLLVQNFPAIGIATGIALLIGLVRLAARR